MLPEVAFRLRWLALDALLLLAMALTLQEPLYASAKLATAVQGRLSSKVEKL